MPLHELQLQLLSIAVVLKLLGGCHAETALIELGEASPIEEAGTTIECHRRLYTYTVTQSDEFGKQCWDTLSVWACWGRCDSNEISDWRFPYKKSSHPVCIHQRRNRAVAILRNCEEGTQATSRRYEYLEADGCHCQQCSSSDTSCEGLRYRPHRSYPGLNEPGFKHTT